MNLVSSLYDNKNENGIVFILAALAAYPLNRTLLSFTQKRIADVFPHRSFALRAAP
jgi:hypothetical protein